MNDLITIYQQHFRLEEATFLRIEHDEAMVAAVYKIILPNQSTRLLKICSRSEDYFREVYYLRRLASLIPIARLIDKIPPTSDTPGAVLMGYIPGELLKKGKASENLAYEIGLALAKIHQNRTEKYGDPTQPQTLITTPAVPFLLKFEEGLTECHAHLPKKILSQTQHFLDAHIHLLSSIDGPCIIHRDFRPGNIITFKNKLQGIIDWASARFGFAEEDFCSLELGEWSTTFDVKKAFLAGYASIRPVPNYQPIIRLLHLNRAFATLGFTIKQKTWNSTQSQLYTENRLFLDNFFKPKTS